MLDYRAVDVREVLVVVVVVCGPVGVVDGSRGGVERHFIGGNRVVMHSLPMVNLRVRIVLVHVADLPLVVCSLVFVASEVLVSCGEGMGEIVQLRPVVSVVVIWVSVLDVCLVIVDSCPVVRVLVEIDWGLSDVVVLLCICILICFLLML